MGEVYRARDPRLKRDVAIKILPEAVSADPERLARFQREAEALASLNHPHVAAIYGLEQANGVFALVLDWSKATRGAPVSRAARCPRGRRSTTRSRLLAVLPPRTRSTSSTAI